MNTAGVGKVHNGRARHWLADCDVGATEEEKRSKKKAEREEEAKGTKEEGDRRMKPIDVTLTDVELTDRCCFSRQLSC